MGRGVSARAAKGKRSDIKTATTTTGAPIDLTGPFP